MDRLCTTGFHGEGRRQVRKAAEAAGAEYSGDLQKDVTTHLVVSDTAGAGAAASAKLLRAAEWGIPALRWAWLKQSAARRRLLPTGLYLYSGTDAAARPQTPLQSSPQAAKAAAPHSPAALPLSPVQDHQQQQQQLCGSRAGAGRAAGSGGAATVKSRGGSDERPSGGRENLDPQPHDSSHAASHSPRQAADQEKALAAELEGLQVQNSPADCAAPCSISPAGGSRFPDEPAAAASQAGSCTESAASDDDDDDFHCAQGRPGEALHNECH